MTIYGKQGTDKKRRVAQALILVRHQRRGCPVLALLQGRVRKCLNQRSHAARIANSVNRDKVQVIRAAGAMQTTA
jgi:hypothetical protein